MSIPSLLQMAADEAAPPNPTGATELNCEVEEKMRMKRTPTVRRRRPKSYDGFLHKRGISGYIPKWNQMDGLQRKILFSMDDFGVMPFMETSWNFHMVYGCFYRCEMKHPRWLDISLNHLKSLKSPRSWLRRGGMKFAEILLNLVVKSAFGVAETGDIKQQFWWANCSTSIC